MLKHLGTTSLCFGVGRRVRDKIFICTALQVLPFFRDLTENVHEERKWHLCSCDCVLNMYSFEKDFFLKVLWILSIQWHVQGDQSPCAFFICIASRAHGGKKGQRVQLHGHNYHFEGERFVSLEICPLLFIKVA